MKKIKKILLILVLLVVVLVIGLAVVIGTNLDKIVKTAVERIAPTITQTPVTLDGVSISLLTGSASLNGFVIGNPDGYKTPSAISIGKAAISLSPGSLLSDKIVIHSIEVRAPEITFEGNPLGANNLSKILDNLKSAPDTNAPVATTTGQPASSKPAKKLEVDDFLITGAQVHATVTGLSSLTSLAGVTNNSFTVTIPEIHLTDLGKGNDGITANELAKTLLNQINTAAVQAVADYAKTNLSGAASGLLKGIKSGESVDQLKKGLGGILGK
jgi:AsmA family